MGVFFTAIFPIEIYENAAQVRLWAAQFSIYSMWDFSVKSMFFILSI